MPAGRRTVLFQTYWRQSAGPRQVLALAWPLMLSTGLFSITLFVDRMLLYWYSDAAASAAMSAGSLFWAIICLPAGMLGYTSTFVAQYFGVQRIDRGLAVVFQGFLLAMALMPIFAIAAVFVPLVFRLAGHAPDLVTIESTYFRYLMPGAWAAVIGAALSGLFSGMGNTRIILAIDLVATAINIVFDALLIFGLLGLPEMGVIGAAIASSLSLVFKAVILGTFAYRFFLKHSSAHQQHAREPIPAEALRKLVLERPLMFRLVRFGWPAGIQLLAESVSFTIIMLLVANLGERAMAATTLALGVNLIAFIPMTGLGLSVGVLVGQKLTAGEPHLAERAVRSGLAIAVAYTSIFAVLYGLLPDYVIHLYSVGTEPDRFREIVPLLKPLLVFIAGYCLFDSLQIVFVGALKGAGDTHFVFLASVAVGLTVVSAGYLGSSLMFPNLRESGENLSEELRAGALFWWWGVITVWVLGMAVVFSIRYLQGTWKSMRVIEVELEDDRHPL